MLQRLTRFRFHVVEAITKEKTYILNTIFLKFNTFSQEKPFSNTFGKTAEMLLTELTCEDIASLSLDGLSTFLMKHGKSRFRNPEELATRLKKIARESYRLRPEFAKSVTFVLALAFRNIRALQQNLKEIDRAIVEELKAFPNPSMVSDSSSPPGLSLNWAISHGIPPMLKSLKRLAWYGNSINPVTSKLTIP